MHGQHLHGLILMNLTLIFMIKDVTGRGGGVGSAAVYAVWVNGANLRVRLRGGTITNISTSIATDIWYNVAVTWDGTTANGYFNGQFVTTLAVGTASNQTNTFTIGLQIVVLLVKCVEKYLRL